MMAGHSSLYIELVVQRSVAELKNVEHRSINTVHCLLLLTPCIAQRSAASSATTDQ